MITSSKFFLLIPAFAFFLFEYVVYRNTYEVFPLILVFITFTPITLFIIISTFLLLFYKKQADIYPQNITTKTTVDIFLPICGESLSVLRNTWLHVKDMKIHSSHNNIETNVFVLDDSTTPHKNIRSIMKEFGFNYIRRPDVGLMKKAGNLKHAFSQTVGKYVVIFDADFAPNKDFLDYTIPIIEQDSAIGIIQTPQKFNLSSVNSWEYGASVYQDFFYDVVQKAWEAFDGAICVGSNAVYRRSALQAIGGTFQIDHSEDIWTGYLLKSIGYKTTYLNKALAFGHSPDNFQAYFKQQMRWCQGSLSLMTSSLFWLAPVRFMTKLCYISGFLFYLTSPLYLILTLIGLVSVSETQNIEVNGALLLATLVSFWIYFKLIMPRSRFITFVVSLSNQIIYSFAILAYFLNIKSTWIPSGTKQKTSLDYSLFQLILGLYVSIYVLTVMYRIVSGNLNVMGLIWILFYMTLFVIIGHNVFQFAFPKRLFPKVILSLKAARKYIVF
jgi:cellulose synthase/poly-beta-1,6-N-acetylglucosamine synthase-like glycosyltransferase